VGGQDAVQVSGHARRLTSQWASNHAERSNQKLDPDLLL
jgi:hypothetical protein